MKNIAEDLLSVLGRFNPWWRGQAPTLASTWRRSVYTQLGFWLHTPPTHRAIGLSGARQTGKTTLMLQAVIDLLERGVPPGNIVYLTFDHPLLKMAGLDAVLSAWREREARTEGPEYLFLDELQNLKDWGSWLKHQVDFEPRRRIVFSGSAMPLLDAGQESGVGRWHTIKVGTLSFFEYACIRKISLPELPAPDTLNELLDWSPTQWQRTGELASDYGAHFHEYVLRGGFPKTALIDDIGIAQTLLREDILDRALRRDMTSLFGVRRVQDLEHTFLYLCLHDGGLLDIPDLCANLEVKRPTAQHFLDLLQASHLIYRLAPYGYGKDILRAKFKVYLADPAISPAVLLKNKALLDEGAALGATVETAVLKHLVSALSPHGARLCYWRGAKSHEVDILVEMGSRLYPFEIKYRKQHTGVRDLVGMNELCALKQPKAAWIVTRSMSDCGLLDTGAKQPTQLLRVPAPLLCWWLGKMEQNGRNPAP